MIVIGRCSPCSNVERRAHRRERSRDARHRPTAQARVADESARERVRRATRRPSGARWFRCCRSRDRVAGRDEPAEPTPVDANVVRRAAGCRRLARAGRRPSSGRRPTGRMSADPRSSVGERREDQRAMRDRLVAGHANGASPAAPSSQPCSSAVARSVFSSRYFTITGVWSDRPCSRAPVAAHRARPGHDDRAFGNLERRVRRRRDTPARARDRTPACRA